MASLGRDTLADKIAAVERHLDRVAQLLPDHPEALLPATEASDGIILHLWQAVQITIDAATSLCVRLKLGAPSTYGNAFEKLQEAGAIDDALTRSMIAATGFRNRIAHAYEKIDMVRVYGSASTRPAELRRFWRTVEKLM